MLIEVTILLPFSPFVPCCFSPESDINFAGERKACNKLMLEKQFTQRKWDT